MCWQMQFPGPEVGNGQLLSACCLLCAFSIHCLIWSSWHFAGLMANKHSDAQGGPERPETHCLEGVDSMFRAHPFWNELWHGEACLQVCLVFPTPEPVPSSIHYQSLLRRAEFLVKIFLNKSFWNNSWVSGTLKNCWLSEWKGTSEIMYLPRRRKNIYVCQHLFLFPLCRGKHQ